MKLTLKEIANIMNQPISKVASERLAICKKCEYYSKWGLCGKCGCVLAVKARIPGMKCPVGKW